MADKINGTIKSIINTDTAIIRVVSYGYYNEFDFDNKDELRIKFTNLNQGHSIDELNDQALEITVDQQPTNLNTVIDGIGKVIQIINTEIFI